MDRVTSRLCSFQFSELWKSTAFLVGALLLLAPLATQAQPTLDGQISASESYNKVAKQDTADGFGAAADLEALYYSVDQSNETIYVATAGTLQAEPAFGALNRHAVWINVTGGSSAPEGVPAGDTLGVGVTDANHSYINGNDEGGDIGFTADFEVDFLVSAGPAFKDPDSLTTAVIGNHTTDPSSIVTFDTTDQAGTPVADQSGLGIEYAFVNDSTATGDSTGVEWKIPFDAIGATPSNDLEVFSVLVNDGGYFSNELVPGNGAKFIGSGVSPFDDNNVGPNADFNFYADSLGETFHTRITNLPVELASFNARKNGEGAVLNWTTASETNNSGFRVQHAVGSGSFEKAGWVSGAGTTTEAQSYSFSLDGLSAGTHRFRLKQVDLDGSSSYSEVVSVEIGPEGPVAIQNVAPHPLQDQGTMRFTMRESGPVTVALYDVLGRQVKTLQQGRVAANQTQQVSIDATSLASGTYFLRVKGESFTRTKRVTVAR